MTTSDRWSLPLLRISMGLFIALWGVDKLAATTGSEKIFEHFYHLRVGAAVVQTAAIAEILLGIALAVGLWRRPVAWIVLLINLTSTVGSWREILDPWGFWGLGKGGTHLFLASIVLLAVAVVLVRNTGPGLKPTGEGT